MQMCLSLVNKRSRMQPTCIHQQHSHETMLCSLNKSEKKKETDARIERKIGYHDAGSPRMSGMTSRTLFGDDARHWQKKEKRKLHHQTSTQLRQHTL